MIRRTNGPFAPYDKSWRSLSHRRLLRRWSASYCLLVSWVLDGRLGARALGICAFSPRR